MKFIALTVSYGLSEYLSFVRDFGVWHQATSGGKVASTTKPRSNLHRLYHVATVYLLAPPLFLLKKKAVGKCEFTIDRQGIVRRSKSGNLELPWSYVLRVHRLSEAYLVEKDGGAMPLPYRVFTVAQREAFESFLHENSVATVGTP